MVLNVLRQNFVNLFILALEIEILYQDILIVLVTLHTLDWNKHLKIYMFIWTKLQVPWGLFFANIYFLLKLERAYNLIYTKYACVTWIDNKNACSTS